MMNLFFVIKNRSGQITAPCCMLLGCTKSRRVYVCIFYRTHQISKCWHDIFPISHKSVRFNLATWWPFCYFLPTIHSALLTKQLMNFHRCFQDFLNRYLPPKICKTSPILPMIYLGFTFILNPQIIFWSDMTVASSNI